MGFGDVKLALFMGLFLGWPNILVALFLAFFALGFAALENALFIFNPFMRGEFTESILTGNFRFLGATLLHVLASGVVGATMALAFYRPKGRLL